MNTSTMKIKEKNNRFNKKMTTSLIRYRVIDKRILVLFLFLSGITFAQTRVAIGDQCNCEVIQGTVVDAPGATSPSGSDLGDLYVNTNTGTIYFWDGTSWELTSTDSNTTNVGLSDDGTNLILTDSDGNTVTMPLADIAAATDTNTTNATFEVVGSDLVITDSDGGTVSVPVTDIAALADTNTTNVGLSDDGTNLILTDSDGNTVTMPLADIAAATDTNTTNATFEVVGSDLVITDSDGGTVSVPVTDIAALADTNTTNVGLSDDGTNLILTDSDGNTVTMPLADIAAATDTNTTNATFEVVGSDLVITDSDGGTVSVPVTDIAALADTNTTNVGLSDDGTNLILTDSDGNTVTMPLADIAAATDTNTTNATFEVVGSDLVITDSDGGTVSVPVTDIAALADTNTTNVGLSDDGTNLILTDSDGNTVTMPLADIAAATDTNTTNATFEVVGSDLVITDSDGGTVSVPVTDIAALADTNTTNVGLSDDGTNLILTDSDGNTVTMPLADIAAATDTNTTNATFEVVGSDLVITDSDGGTVSVPVTDIAALADTNTTNVGLSDDGTNLILTDSDGNTVTMPLADIAAATDTNTTNATFEVVGSDLVITDSDGGTVSVPVADIAAATNTDDQTLTLTGTDLSIEDGNTVNLNAIADGDAWGVDGEDQASAIGRTGNVGIGTTAPTQRLTIDGNITTVQDGQRILFPHSNAVDGNDGTIGSGAFEEGLNIVGTQTVAGNGRRITTFGDVVNQNSVGIGNVVPTSALDVNGTTRLRNIPAGEAADGILTTDANGNIRQRTLAEVAGAGSDGDAWGVTGEDQASVIGRTGDVGIGIAVPTQKLQVDGNQTFTSDGNFLRFPNTNQTDGNDGIISAGLFEEGLNIVGVQTVAGNGRRITTFGDVVHQNSVGIGNVVPTSVLDVNGDARVRNIPAGAAADGILTTDANGNIRQRTLAEVAGAGSDGDAWGVTGEDIASNIGRTGNVGVGTATPRAGLELSKAPAIGATVRPLTEAVDVANSGNYNYVLSNSDNATVGAVSGFSSEFGGFNTYLQARGFAANGPAYNLLFNPVGGNVGIGTTAPTQRLTIDGNITTVQDGQRILFPHSNAVDGNDGTIGSGAFEEGLNIVGTQTVAGNGRRITTFGDVVNQNSVGIGNVVPTSALDVNGTTRLRNIPAGEAADGILTTDANGNIRQRTLAEVAGAGSDGDAWGVTGEDQASVIGRTGDVGIGIAVPTQKLQVDGNQTFTSDGNFLRFPNTNQTDGNDGIISAGLFEEGLNIVGVQTVAGNGRRITTFGDVVHQNSVGIGNVVPTSVLDVNGDARVRNIPAGAAADVVVTADANGNIRQRTAAEIVAASGVSGADGDAWGVTGEDIASNIGRTGNVGIGTTTPRAGLELSKTPTIGATVRPLSEAVNVANSSNYNLVLSNSDNATIGAVSGFSTEAGGFNTYLQARGFAANAPAYNLLFNPLGGNVGVNNANPVSPFTVGITSNGSRFAGDVRVGNANGDTRAALVVGEDSANNGFIVMNSSNSSAFGQEIQMISGVDNANSDFMRMRSTNLDVSIQGALRSGVGDDSEFNLVARNNIVTLSGDSNGGGSAINFVGNDIGIDNTNPTASVDINGNARVRNIPAGVATDGILTTDVNGNIRQRTLAEVAGAGSDGDAWGVTGEDQVANISRSGNVTISNTNREALTIQTPDNSASNGIAFQNSGGSYTWNMFRETAVGNDANLVFSGGQIGANPSDLTERMRINANGNVGIGTSAPAANLQVGSGTPLGILQSPDLLVIDDDPAAGSTALMRVEKGLSNASILATETSSRIATVSFGSAENPSTELFSSQAQGAGLRINGGNQFREFSISINENDSRIESNFGSGSTSDFGSINFLNQQIGFNTNTPTRTLDVNGQTRIRGLGAGSVQSDANGNLSVSSDIRLKNVVGNFKKGLNALRGINPIAYQWNEKSGLEQKGTYIGFSAQNVQANIPEAISKDEKGYLTLDNRPILATMVNALKELTGQIDTLKQDNNDLNEENKNLKEENEAIMARLDAIEAMLRKADK
ncbi:hypothetical protein EJ994_10280 [Maribacter sp. MJ134]|uniref:tail fiber domain-containing protein n=1 Tax=Maribacter sp. MJ134 TaxID=2496865 RepID=UPI000F84C549|nr:tail fiber domain-containing protein [Maribacter sp. MJ134]AZQ59172.1 hypothetical protein EJ994_10280 [Maribacter sp. MJ134]